MNLVGGSVIILSVMIQKITTLITRTFLPRRLAQSFSSQPPKPAPLRIQTLSQLLEQRKSNEPLNLDSQFQPSSLFITIIKCLKKNLYVIPEQQQKMMAVLNKYKNNIEYVRMFVYIVLPVDQLFPQLNQFYTDIAEHFLTQTPIFHKEQLYYILQNLQRIITDLKSSWTDEHWVLRDYTKQQRIASLLVPQLIAMSHEFNISVLIKLTKICGSLRVSSPELGQFLLANIELPICRVKMNQVLMVITYLSQLDSFPYQYFYKHKQKWMTTITSYNKFSSKKSYESIKLLHILILQNPMFCQKLIKRVQDVLLQAMPSLDPEELANLWYICSRAKFGIYAELVEKMLGKMGEVVRAMGVRELCLVVRGFESFGGLVQYREDCQGILKEVSKKLDDTRVYQHEVIKQLLAKLEPKQQPAHKAQ